MDETRAEQDQKAATAPTGRDERARAAAYLDLWQRHITQVAIHGPEPPTRTPE